MGLKCSVIGHKYGEAEVEREREEQGSEVVITIQERETCERCGKTRIVSENKEVTAIETPSDIAGDMIDEGGPAADEDGDNSGEPAAGSASDETTPDDEAPAAPDEAESAPPSGETETDDAVVDAVDPDADDAEILDDDGTGSGDSELDDPSTEVSVGGSEEPEPALDAEESAVATDPESDDGMIIDGDEDESPVDDREPGEWPEEPSDDGDGWAPETGESADDGTSEDDESPEVEPFGGSAVTVPEGQFRCPECEFTTDVASSSLRAGDFCPECHKGALVNTAE
ncbi:DUF7093 family protein [Haloarcula laminariae]|uniref:DUF7093 family protein n=1 Tax=Haloarcula laminariae TaxID=2961577 RepID=UPI002404B8AD|nr:hypothetical protein [Halomicroarcula sp. FL173]